MQATKTTRGVDTPATRRTRRSRRPTARRRLGALGLATMLMLVTSGCNVSEGNHYGVSFGAGSPVSYYARIFQKPTWQVVVWNDAAPVGAFYCGGDELCTIRMLRDRVQFNGIAGWLSGIDYFFRDSEVNDFRQALDGVRGNSKCLMMHHNPGNIIGDRYNWTNSDPGGDCKVGELVTL